MAPPAPRRRSARPSPTPRPAPAPAPPRAALPEPVTAFAVCAPGLEALMRDELTALGLDPQAPEAGGVPFQADLPALARANVWLATASRVLVRLGHADTRHFADLERLAASLPWRALLPPEALVRLNATARKSRLYHTGAIAQRVAAAISAQRPGVRVTTTATSDDDGEAASQLVVVRIERDHCVISLDSSGELLHRRGWRQATAKAPLRETLAAALLGASGWTPDAPLWDPCCGAGTIVIEAARRAAGRAPGESRDFACMAWPVWRDRAVSAVRYEQQRSRDGARPVAAGQFTATDRDAGAIAAARSNAERAGVLPAIRFEQVAVADVTAPTPAGWLVSNPPYGKRVQPGGSAAPTSDAALRALYRQLGAQAAAGWRLALLTDDAALAREAGLRGEPLVATRNGGLAVGIWGTREGAPGRRGRARTRTGDGAREATRDGTPDGTRPAPTPRGRSRR